MAAAAAAAGSQAPLKLFQCGGASRLRRGSRWMPASSQTSRSVAAKMHVAPPKPTTQACAGPIAAEPNVPSCDTRWLWLSGGQTAVGIAAYS